VFDTPDINKEFLPAYLDAEINRQPQVGIDFRELGSQRYVAVHLSNAA
jgi:hypothetical protein